MKTTEEIINDFSEKLNPFGFYPLKISKNPTWVNATIQNGIEISANDVKTFKIEMGERNYTAETEAVTKKALNEVFYKKEESAKKIKLPELPDHSIKEAMELERPSRLPAEIKKEVVGILPDFFTDELMEKWKKLSGIKRLLDVQHTPSYQIYRVEVGTDNGKPVMASYVKANYMITEANYVFLFDWNYEIVDVSLSETGVSVRGIFVGELDGKHMKKTSVGYQERNKKMDAQQATKAALTDAIKKALSYMGFNRDVYGGEI